MNITTQLVTPEMARQWLQANSNNRRIRKTLIARLKADIESGNWQMTHQPIALAEDGQLIDGQHRLSAIVAAGIAVPLTVATNCAKETFAVIDSGVKRTAADSLHVEGIKNANVLSAAIRYYLCYRHLPGLVWTGQNIAVFSTSQIAKEYSSCKDLWDRNATRGCKAYSRFRLLSKPASACLFVLMEEAGYTVAQIEAFADDLSTGAMLAMGDPVFALRSSLTAGNSTSATCKVQGTLAAYIKAFNYRREGVHLKLFKWPSVPPMPSIVPPDA